MKKRGVCCKMLCAFLLLAAFAACAKDEISDGGKEYVKIDESYRSTDFSKDGEVTWLYRHSKGNGIPIVLVGDAYVDRQMEAGGLYEMRMEEAYMDFFSIEPFTSLKEYFDVVMVKAVSEGIHVEHIQKEWFELTPQDKIHTGTALGSYKYGDRGIELDSVKVAKYVIKALDMKPDAQGKYNLNPVTVMIPINMSGYFGTSNQHLTGGGGFGFAMSSYNNREDFMQTMRHEAGGHAFGLLADEYVGGMAPEDIESSMWWLDYSHRYLEANYNVISAEEPCWWQPFLDDPRYAGEKLGLYEGGNYVERGVFRPTQNSIMNELRAGFFNAPSRYLIYVRAMRIANGDTRPLADFYDDFVAFDENGRKDAALKTSQL